MALLNVTTPLVSAEATAELAAILPHLQAVTLAALPRADEMTEVLVKALVIALLTLKEYDTARAIADQVKVQEAASGRALLPANLDETFRRIEANTIQITEGMHLILQSLVCLAADMPVPLAVVYNVFEPGAGIDTAVTELVALKLVTQPEAQTVQLTARGRNLIGHVQTEVEESVVSALVKVTNQAIAADDKLLLGQLEPHMRALATQVLPRVDAAARHLLSALCQCLVHLGNHMGAVEYIDTFEKLERTPEIFRHKENESPVEREQSLQYHAQAGVHYYVKGNYEQASRHFEKAIPATDDAAILAGLYQKLGECYGVLGDGEAELTAYITALEQALAHYGRDSW
jgi:tetratricopeptide (TPR) repeat protein